MISGRRASGLGRSRGLSSYGPISSADPGSSKSVERCESFPPKVQGFHGNTSLAMSEPGAKDILNWYVRRRNWFIFQCCMFIR